MAGGGPYRTYRWPEGGGGPYRTYRWPEGGGGPYRTYRWPEGDHIGLIGGRRGEGDL